MVTTSRPPQSTASSSGSECRNSDGYGSYYGYSSLADCGYIALVSVFSRQSLTPI